METKSVITTRWSWSLATLCGLPKRIKYSRGWVGLVLTVWAMGWSPSTRPATQPATSPDVMSLAPFPGQVLGDIRILNFRDPSGIIYHAGRGTLFVVGDKGDIAEVRTDGKLIQRQRFKKMDFGKMDFEGITCDPSTGRLYIAVEGSEKILEVDPDGLRMLRVFTLSRQFNGKIVLDPGGQGIEGITYVPDPKDPQKGRFFLANQSLELDADQDASAIFTVALPLRSNQACNDPIPIDWYLRFPITDISGLHYDASRNLLFAISDINDCIMQIDLQGRILAAYVLPGQDQEGVTLDKEGILYIAQDSGGILKCRFNPTVSTAPASSGTEAAPTPATLEKWMENKEFVEVCFAGPHVESMQLRNSLKTKVPTGDQDFLLSAGEGGGTNRSFIDIHMKVTPENIRRVLAIQAEMEVRGYHLDPKVTRVWVYQGDAGVRAKARALVPEFLAAVSHGIEKAIPTAVCTLEKGGMRYDVPKTHVRGMVRISEITTRIEWDLCVVPDLEVYLPHLALRIDLYYRPGQVGALEEVSLYRDAVRKAFSTAVEPILKLEPGAAVRTWPKLRRP